MILENALPGECLVEWSSCAHSGIENTKNPLLAFKEMDAIQCQRIKKPLKASLLGTFGQTCQTCRSISRKFEFSSDLKMEPNDAVLILKCPLLVHRHRILSNSLLDPLVNLLSQILERAPIHDTSQIQLRKKGIGTEFWS